MIQGAPTITVPRKQQYDAIIVGGGMTGGWAAMELCERGLNVLLLERGGRVEHGHYPTEWQKPWQVPLHGERRPEEYQRDYPVQSKNYAFGEATKHFFVKDSEHPYLTPADKPFRWIRGYQLGGRSLLWGRIVWRWSDLDFGANARDGHGVDWPIRYADLAPWYSRVERYIGVSGNRDGIPHIPDGEFLPPWEMNCVEKEIKGRIESAYPDRHMIIGRVTNLTQAHGGRGPCQARNQCARGCSFGGYFCAVSSTIPAAEKTGRLTVVTDAVAQSVLYDEQRERASGVRVVDAHSGQSREYYGRLLFLCASTLGTTQLLLNSRSRRFPNGMANGSGALGHYLMDHHSKAGARGTVPGFEDSYVYGRRPAETYIPRFRNLPGNKDGVDFVRGYGLQGGASRGSWGRGAGEAGVGEELKRNLREPGRWSMYFQGYGECLPRYDNYVELDPERKDRWGIPLLRIHCSWGENEMRMREDLKTQAAEILEAAGCRDVAPYDDNGPPGFSVHEMGTARMGRDPKSSVLNGHNQAHEVKNLFVTDGSCMASNNCVNPSLTYMALTARAAAFAVEEMKRGNL